MDDEITPQPLLKKPEIKRDPEGRFERHGKTISKTSKKRKPSGDALVNLLKSVQDARINKPADINPETGLPRRGPGRPKGSQNKTTLALKEAILRALDDLGGHKYWVTLGIENSSAFAGLLGKVLPSTLSMPETSGGEQTKVTFERVVVWPDGRREIEGVTPKQLPAPSPLSVENNDQSNCVEKPSQHSASNDQ